MKPELLLEIGCEEIPAWMLPGARSSFKQLLEQELKSCGLLGEEPVQTFATPRRLVAICRRLALAEPTRTTETIGPPQQLAYDAAGKPTRAAASFAAKAGIGVEQLELLETPKGTYVVARQEEKGRATAAILAELLPAIIPKIEFPRTMYWSRPQDLRFVRPIRWLLALWRGKLLGFELGGLSSQRVSYGHRLINNQRFRVRDLAHYQQQLRRAHVLLDPLDRRERILRQCGELLRPARLRLREDKELLDLLVDLVEYPTVILGSFDRSYMELPSEILITVMRHHQRYLSVEDARGNLAPYFLAVIDLDRDRTGEICRGHQAVLAARFRDAKFFWHADQKHSPEERLPLLEERIFISALGSFRQKVDRLARLTGSLAEKVFADGRRADIATATRAARLCKSDLTTEMVGEFPELQGVVGGIYARVASEPEAVAKAIYEQYKPSSRDDTVPGTLEGCLLAIADKLDTIAGCFSAGLEPTGSRDPFAVRRAGIGVVRIVVEGRLRLSLSEVVGEAVSTLVGAGAANADSVARAVLEFFEERARHLFIELRGFRHDEVDAAFAAGWDDLVDVAARLEAIRTLRPTKDFEPLAVAFKRIRNILEQAGGGHRWVSSPVEESLFEPGAEKELYDRFLALRPEVAELRRRHRYAEALKKTACLRPQVDRYFDTVLVMAKDESVRQNRLAFLAHLLQEFSTVADFSALAVEPKAKE